MLVPRFRIHVEQAVLDDLELRLAQVRFARFSKSGGWDHGTSPEYLEDLLHYWRHQFDWRHQEGLLNRMAQYKVRIKGNDLHFVHERGRGNQSLPLLLLHGWPDSFYRFHKVIPVLSEPVSHGGAAIDAFDVVVPSLPGFGFTGHVKFENEEQPLRHAAQMLWHLMTEILGYKKFVVAGGDIGRTVAQIIAIDYPESVVAVHLTDISAQSARIDPSALTKPEQKFFAEMKQWGTSDGVYQQLQQTKPRSLAPALNDSPAGLASWIIDRFHAWSDHNGNLNNAFSKDELLTNIMVYWVTETITPSMFIYYAETTWPSLKPTDFVKQPVGMALFPKDIGGIPPRQLAERSLNVQRWAEMPHGGHFAAWEMPELYVNELRAFFRDYRNTVSETPDGNSASAEAIQSGPR